MLETDIVLIGPTGSGKSTLAGMVGEALGVPFLDLDEIRAGYYREIGYDNEHALKLQRESGTGAMVAYWKQFEIHSVERMFQDYPARHVLAFGAGQSVYEEPEFSRRAQRVLAPHIVILLLPSPDVEESLRLLHERVHLIVPQEVLDTVDDMNRYFLEHPANATFADHTVYTKGRAPQETRDEILGLLD